MSVTDDIKARLDILDVLSPYVNLQKSGRTFKSVCPFHTEKTPSFIINPERQSWRCFGACAEGGDIFNFIMKAENLQFGDALRLLARKAGVEIQGSQNREQSNAIHSVNKAAAIYYQQVLASEAGKIGRDYLDQRKVGRKARDQFVLGLSPDRWDGLKEYLLANDFKIEDAIRAGLVRQDENNNRSWDFFRNRLMFPIFDRDGNVAGFGARALDDSTPKYLNTAQTEIFDKRNTLYALNFARSTIRQSGKAVIVEGYMDAIAAHEHGYDNVVASMGTALTENQVSQLRSLAQDFVLALDPDMAGQEATLRSLESSWHVFRSVISRRVQGNQSVLNQWTPPVLKIAALPPGLDPDALIRTDPERWETTVNSALPLLDFVIPALVERTDLSVPDSRAAIVRELGRLINLLDEMDQYEYWRKLAEAIGVPLETLSASISSARPRRRGRRGNNSAPWESEQQVEVSTTVLTQQIDDPLEDYTLGILIRRPELLGSIGEISPDCFRRTENRELFTAMQSCPTLEELREDLDAVVAEHLSRLESQAGPDTGAQRSEAALAECMRRLELRRLYQIQETFLQTDEISQPPSREVEDPVKEVNERIRELQSMGVRPG